MKDLQTALDEARTRMSEPHKITITLTTMDLNSLKRDFETRFKEAMEKEVGKDKKPATYVYNELHKAPVEDFERHLVAGAVFSYINGITRTEMSKYLQG